jgi:hypothetical protein
MQDNDGLVGEGVDSKSQDRRVRGEIVLDAVRRVASFPSQAGQVIRVRDNRRPGAGLRDPGRGRMGSGRYAVVDMDKVDGGPLGSELARNVPFNIPRCLLCPVSILSRY